jgi:hypothetical protein
MPLVFFYLCLSSPNKKVSIPNAYNRSWIFINHVTLLLASSSPLFFLVCVSRIYLLESSKIVCWEPGTSLREVKLCEMIDFISNNSLKPLLYLLQMFSKYFDDFIRLKWMMSVRDKTKDIRINWPRNTFKVKKFLSMSLIFNFIEREFSGFLFC